MSYDYRLPLMLGVDIPMPEFQITLHVPRLKEIALMGESQFFLAIQYLCLEKENLVQDETVLSSLTNFQVMMKVLQQSKDSDKKMAIMTLLQFLFPEYTAMMTPNSIFLTREGQTVMIDNENFEQFQTILKEVLCVNNIFQGQNVIYKPANDRAKEIADKLMRGRRKAAELNAQQGNTGSVLTRYISILSTAGIASIQESSEYTLFQLFDQIDRYTKKLEWDTDQKVKLAGGKTEKQVDFWMMDIHPNK